MLKKDELTVEQETSCNLGRSCPPQPEYNLGRSCQPQQQYNLGRQHYEHNNYDNNCPQSDNYRQTSFR